MKNKNISIAVIIIILILFGIFFAVNNKYKNTPLEPVNTLINVLYFNKGTYDDYKNIFTKPSNAFKEKDFNEFRKNPNKKQFIYGSNSSSEIMKHVKSEVNGNNGTVYYLKNINSKNEIKSAFSWKVEKVNGKWLLKNN